MSSLRLTWVLAALLAVACKDGELKSSMGALHLEPARVDLGKTFVGQQVQAQLTLRNEGRSRLAVEWKDIHAPFEVVLLPLEAESGSNEVLIRAIPGSEGTFRGTLEFNSEAGSGLAELEVVATNVPTCMAQGACSESTFNPATGQCEERQLADGIACDVNSVCVLGGTCQAGRCVGTPVSCDDGNACTVDVCNAVNGCEHLPAPPCPGDGSCKKGVCNPQTGCELAPMDDGAACGPIQTCDAAQVCIAGACVTRDPPDGYVCAQASPCQGEGRCEQSSCVRPAAVALTPKWQFDSMTESAPDSGVPQAQYHDFVVEPSGQLSLMGFFHSPPKIRANSAQPIVAEAAARRCMLWNNRLICADYPSSVNGKISALSLGDGQVVWTFDVRSARPDFLSLTNNIFMARMGVQGSDRLAALFEAYPKSVNPQATSKCRLYFLVVLDAAGHLVSGQQLTDAVLDQCNHPHPYGFAADSVGNLFISFSKTVGEPAPLIPGNNTTVMSFTRDGVFRWKFTDPNLVGGELAVATGLLYPENSPIAISAATGATAHTLSAPFGRLVVTGERSVPAPTVGQSVLRGYEAGTPTERWMHTLKAGETFWSDQLRLARWQVRGGDRTVALTFTERLGKPYLKAIDTRDGSEGFACELNFDHRTAPQLVEVSETGLSMMEGSNACGKCDPPFANSSAAFHSFELRLISPAHEPWLGTFGGPSHDHREETLLSTPPLPEGR